MLQRMTEPRLLIERGLRNGEEIALTNNQARHVGAVLRLDVGGAVRVFNAADGEWRARIISRNRHAMSVRVEEFVRAAREVPDLDLLFAPVKRHATDIIVEKATELGARRLRPILTQRTIAETVRGDRLQAIAREAAEQTERFDVPEILDAQPLAKALDGWDPARRLIYADEAGDDTAAPWGGETGRAQAIIDALHEVAPSPGAGDARGPLALLIGPEGGFTPEERRMLRGLSFVVPVSLGPRILRAETAVIAALSIIQAVWGDWRRA